MERGSRIEKDIKLEIRKILMFNSVPVHIEVVAIIILV